MYVKNLKLFVGLLLISSFADQGAYSMQPLDEKEISINTTKKREELQISFENYWKLHHKDKKIERSSPEYKEAMSVFVEKGFPGAMSELGLLLSEETSPNFKKVEELFQQAGSKGEPLGWVNLGQLYSSQYKNKEKAKEFYKKAIADDEPLGMHNLGVIYITEKKYKKAKELFLKASEMGCQTSKLALGGMLQQGLGGEKNKKKAHESFQQVLEKTKDSKDKTLVDSYYTHPETNKNTFIQEQAKECLERRFFDTDSKIEGLIQVGPEYTTQVTLAVCTVEQKEYGEDELLIYPVETVRYKNSDKKNFGGFKKGFLN